MKVPFGSVTPRHRALDIYLLQEGICFLCTGRVSSPLLEPGRALWTLLAASHSPVIRFCQEEPWWFQELPSEVELRMRIWSTRGWEQLVLPMEGQPGLGHLEPLHMVTICPGARPDKSFDKNI